jgi:hypothetical protein
LRGDADVFRVRSDRENFLGECGAGNKECQHGSN